MSRISDVIAVLDLYPEIIGTGVPTRRIAEECCRRIPIRGIEDGRTPQEVAEIAAELTIGAIVSQRFRGTTAANYLVATFKGVAHYGITNMPPGISRVGLSTEDAERRKLEAETLRRREADAQRPLPDPTLPRRALERMRPKPGEGEWVRGKPAPKLPPRRPEVEADRCEPIGDLVPRETIRGYRDAVKFDEGGTADDKGAV